MRIQNKLGKSPVNRLFSLFIILCVTFIAQANPIPKDKMIALGKEAFRRKAMDIDPNQVGSTLKDVRFVDENGEPLLAILNFDQGFLIIAGDDASMPILAYSFTGNFDLEHGSPGARMWVKQYQQEISIIRQMQSEPTDEIKQEWQELSNSNAKSTTSVVVSPLITSRWNQTKYYNQYSPEDTASPRGYDSRTPNGCVAVAMAQIIYYYRYPIHGTGSHTNYTNYGNYYVNFANQTYCYEAMTDQLSSYNNEVAKLIFHCATSVDMNYSPDGSGAYSENVPNALKSYFGYTANCEYKSKSSYSSSSWIEMLKSELDASRPLYYSGYSDDGGHAFVCDGYNTDNLFHFNFGWGGYQDGYFALSNTGGNSNAVNGFSSGQAIVRNFYPGDANYPYDCDSKVINCTNGTLEDGSNANNYRNNSNCTYVITADQATSVYVNFQYFDTEEGHDSLSFWDGNPSNGHLLTTLSGSMPAHNPFSFSTDSLYITFITDGSTTGGGWRFDYDVQRIVSPCNSMVYHNYSGSLTDGSGTANYRSGADCIWTLRLPEATHITFTFSAFDISPEDKLDFYDVSSFPRVLIASYTGSTIPSPITLYHNKVMLNFVSDNYLNRDGFALSWLADSITPAVESISDFNSDQLTIYPNPTSGLLYLKISEPLENGVVTLYDLAGRQVYTQKGDFSTDNSIKLDVNSLPSGFYTVVLQNNTSIWKRKLLKY